MGFKIRNYTIKISNKKCFKLKAFKTFIIKRKHFKIDF